MIAFLIKALYLVIAAGFISLITLRKKLQNEGESLTLISIAMGIYYAALGMFFTFTDLLCQVSNYWYAITLIPVLAVLMYVIFKIKNNG